MEVRKRASIKSFPYDDFKDNDSLERIAEELNEGGANVVLGSLDAAINWGRSNSPWSLTFGTSCCGIEFMSIGCSRYDMARFGWEVTRNSPRQADLIMCAGTITNKMAPVFKRLYDEMAEPKYVVAVGGCTISGGPFKKSYSVVRGIDELVPVDVYIPGCPPRPEAIIYGMMQLQRKIKVEKFFGGANHKMNSEEKAESLKLGGLRGLSNENFSADKLGNNRPIIVTETPAQEKIEELGKELDTLEQNAVKAENTPVTPATPAAPATESPSTETNNK
ncbi:NADH-quinone oxidoreductase, B subunit [Prevotella sp. DNF00663]|uniref:NADH-quinone oxidoreductase subunit B n=1 Tax=unclassified Prevotella TaxID=2638335 RepID=UPI0005140845|nr:MULTISPECIES: NADH-quinone oxidoreductase subunit B [unclassified Prevotella]KGI60699.1 NADH dehydrogenase [Prevotella sp. S7 MS 2]KXB84939.1 NADH-quinone oxidoreductase, B subunit [Prevotella sp. DNF00663]